MLTLDAFLLLMAPAAPAVQPVKPQVCRLVVLSLRHGVQFIKWLGCAEGVRPKGQISICHSLTGPALPAVHGEQSPRVPHGRLGGSHPGCARPGLRCAAVLPSPTFPVHKTPCSSSLQRPVLWTEPGPAVRGPDSA